MDLSSLTIEQLEAIRSNLTEKERQEFDRLISASLPTLAELVERTFNLKLDPWQIFICQRLEKLRWQKGQRILIHAPSQLGKSIIVSQRFPAYILGCNPLTRIGLVAYNQTHAKRFSVAVQKCMRMYAFRSLFPNPHCRLPNNTPQDLWSTEARHSIGDATASVIAAGMDSGLTGHGFDLLIVDDPYADAGAANSVIENENIHLFWNATVKPRLNDDTNVVIMFHRYHDDDFAGWLMQQEPGVWEYLRFAAIADDNEEFPDPLGRKPGELLTTRRSREFFESFERADPMTFWGQLQGLPRPLTGGMFEPSFFKETEDYTPYLCEPDENGNLKDEHGRWRYAKAPPPLDVYVRSWDLATSEKQAADHTAGALMGLLGDGTLLLADMVRIKSEWHRTEELILNTVARDRELGVQVGIEDAGLGLLAFQALSRRSEFLSVPLRRIKLPTGQGKKERALAWQAKLASGKFKLLKGDWNKEFIAECLAFSGRLHGKDDQIDAVSNGTQMLFQMRGGYTEKKPLDPFSEAYWKELVKSQTGGDKDYYDNY